MVFEEVRFRLDDGASQHEYLVKDVRVNFEWLGKRPRLADRRNLEFTDGYHLEFEIDSEEFEETTTTGKDIRTLQRDVEDENTKVEIQVMSTSDSWFEVNGNVGQALLFQTEYGTRRDPDIIRCITKNKLSKSEMNEFEK